MGQLAMQRTSHLEQELFWFTTDWGICVWNDGMSELLADQGIVPLTTEIPHVVLDGKICFGGDGSNHHNLYMLSFVASNAFSS